MQLNDRTDWELLNIRQNINDAYLILFKRHRDFIFRLAYGFSGNKNFSGEITQEVFLRLYQKRKKWKEKAAFRTLLYRITLNCFRELSKKSPQYKLLEVEDEIQEDIPDDNLEKLSLRLDSAIEILPVRQREVVTLRYFEELSVKETADILKCSEGTVKTHLHRAIQTIKSRFNHKYEQ